MDHEMLWRKQQLNWRYALGEFAIVVLGVLSALWVENWNSDRQDRTLEMEYLESMVAELELDDASILDAMQFAEDVSNRSRSVLNAIDEQQFAGTPEDFARSVELTAYLRFPTYSRATINDLMATGNLRLLRSEAVRDSIAAYYSTIEWNSQWNDTARDAQFLMAMITTKILDVADREFLFSETDGSLPWAPDSLDVSRAEGMNILNELVEHPDARGLISYMIREQGALYGRLTRIREELRKLSSELLAYREKIGT